MTYKWFCDLIRALLQSDIETFTGGPLCYDMYHFYIPSSKVQEMSETEGFVSSEFYPDETDIIPNEIGSISNFRIIVDNTLEHDHFKIEARFAKSRNTDKA